MTMRTLFGLLASWLLTLGGCLMGGCYAPQTAGQAMRFSNPAFEIERTWSGGVKVHVGTDAKANGKFTIDEKTGKITGAEFNIESTAGSVVKEEGLRITDTVLALMTQNYKTAEVIQHERSQALVQTTGAVMQGISSIAGMMSMGGAKPEAVKGFVESMTPMVSAAAATLVPVLPKPDIVP